MSLSARERDAIKKAVEKQMLRSDSVVTSWCIITGAPGSGKTTLVETFKSEGWHTVPDPGRAEYEHQIALGRPSELSRKEYSNFQQLVLNRFVLSVDDLGATAQIIFDYGLAESLAFLKLTGTPWSDNILEAAVKFRFHKIFVLDMVVLDSCVDDGVRTETEKERALLRSLIIDIYVCLGYEPLHVPLMPVEQRFEWVKERI